MTADYGEVSEDKKSGIWTIFVVLFVIVLLIVYIGTLGGINVAKISKPEEFLEDREKARLRHQRLLGLVQKQQALKIKLGKKFRLIYGGVRVGLVLSWIAVMFGCYLIGWIANLEDFLNVSEICLIILVTANFITFGTLTHLNGFLTLIRTRTENWVYGKYISLEEKIMVNKEQLKDLEQKL